MTNDEKNKVYNLFLDDIRNPSTVQTYMALPVYNNSEWEIVRSFEEFINKVIDMHQAGFTLKRVSFDHDLGESHYEIQNWKEEEIYSRVGTDNTGYNCAKFLANFIDHYDLPIPTILIHSQNPVGKENIENYLGSWIDKKCQD